MVRQILKLLLVVQIFAWAHLHAENPEDLPLVVCGDLLDRLKDHDPHAWNQFMDSVVKNGDEAALLRTKLYGTTRSLPKEVKLSLDQKVKAHYAEGSKDEKLDWQGQTPGFIALPSKRAMDAYIALTNDHPAFFKREVVQKKKNVKEVYQNLINDMQARFYSSLSQKIPPQVLPKIISAIHLGIQKSGLFVQVDDQVIIAGSLANGRARSGSDIDLIFSREALKPARAFIEAEVKRVLKEEGLKDFEIKTECSPSTLDQYPRTADFYGGLSPLGFRFHQNKIELIVHRNTKLSDPEEAIFGRSYYRAPDYYSWN